MDYFRKVLIEKGNEFIDKCVIDLINRTDCIKIKENYSNFDLYFVINELKEKGYELKYNTTSPTSWDISLYYMDRLKYKYKINIIEYANELRVISTFHSFI